MKYNWSSQDLRNDLQTLLRMLKEEQDPLVREKIYQYIDETKAMIIDEEMSDDVVERSFRYDDVELRKLCKEVSTYNMYYPIIRDFRNKIADTFIKYKQKAKKQQVELSQDDIVELIHELFKSTNKEFYQMFLEMYKRNDKHIRFYSSEPISSSGRMFFIPGLNKQYIEIARKSGHEALLTLAHEEGHAIASAMNQERYMGLDTTFCEIESTFFELLANDFFYDELKLEVFPQEMLNLLGKSYDTSNEILGTVNIARRLFSMNNPTLNELQKLDYDLAVRVENIICYDPSITSDVNYVFSHIVAIELFELYKEDKDLALSILKEIIQRKKDQTEYQSIITNVSPNKSLVKHKDRIMTRLNE